MKLRNLFLLLLFLPLTGATKLPPGFQEDLIVFGLRYPVSAEYSPDGRLFILEKQGRVRIFKDGKLLKKPFLKVDVNSFYERGLLGIAFDPDFQKNNFVYIYRTTNAERPENIVERYQANGDIAVLSSRKVLVRGIRSDSGIHNAGCLKFGPDGKLYISTGDGGATSALAQDLTSLNGKILRINSDGTVPSDNPFFGRSDARPEIWCYGLRNPWRFALDPETGLIVIGDVGGNGHEELNIGKAGSNFGWPLAEGPSENPSLIDPAYSYSHVDGGAAVIGGAFYKGIKFPSKYRGRLFFTDYARKFLRVTKVDASGLREKVSEFATGLTTPVHLLQAPDGSLVYIGLLPGEVRKIRFVGGKNRPPVVESGSSRRSGLAPLTVRFHGRGTEDPDGDPLTYEWDFGDKQKSNLPSVEHNYVRNGTYHAYLTVRDNHGGTGYGKTLKIVVGNEAPVPIILQPAPGTVVRPGDTIHFSGKGTDPEDGKILPENMFWSARLHHNDHTHPAMGGVRGASGTLKISSTLHAGGTLFFRLNLRVTDSEGLSKNTHIDLPLQTN